MSLRFNLKIKLILGLSPSIPGWVVAGRMAAAGTRVGRASPSFLRVPSAADRGERAFPGEEVASFPGAASVAAVHRQPSAASALLAFDNLQKKNKYKYTVYRKKYILNETKKDRNYTRHLHLLLMLLHKLREVLLIVKLKRVSMLPSAYVLLSSGSRVVRQIGIAVIAKITRH